MMEQGSKDGETAARDTTVVNEWWPSPGELDFPIGLQPARDVGSSRMILIVKTTREMAETARLRKSFHFYLVPVLAGGVHTHGLITAFFDDDDEPLTLRTPLFDQEMTRKIFKVLSSESFDVHFFDEYNRKLIGFRAENPDATRLESFANRTRFVPGTLGVARQFHDDMVSWFSNRSTTDDDAAFRINLLETLPPDNLYSQDQAPGDFNEHEIEIGLNRAFNGNQIYRNPMRIDDGREFVDLLVTTAENVLLVQAKSSPITAETLDRSIDRKKATTLGHVKKAAAQLKGSINHLQSSNCIEVIVDGRRSEVSMAGRDVVGLVIVKELFDLERPACSQPVFSIFDKTGIPCLLMDYQDFQQLTYFRGTEESLVGTLQQNFSIARELSVFPRLRFGLVPDGPKVHRYSLRRSLGSREDGNPC